MTPSASDPNSARQASRALHAWRSGELSRLVPELEFIRSQAASTAGMSAAEAERWDLLAGIAEHVRKMPGNPDQSSADVCVELLEHLSRAANNPFIRACQPSRP